MTEAQTVPRIKDVAARAGVSVGTVSHVLNHPEKVAEPTRRRVQDAIRDLGFVRDANARSLAAGGSRSIGLVAIDLGNSLFAEAARGAQASARAAGLSLLITGSDDDYDVQSDNVDTFVEARVSGLLLAPMQDSAEQLERFTSRGRPAVLMNYDPGTDDVCRAVVDNERVGELAAAHLIDQGCRRLAYVFARPEAQPVALRRRGIHAAVAAAGGTVQLEEILADDLTAADGARVAADLAARQPGARPDGIIAVTDLLAVGLIEELSEQGVDVPGDVAVMGCDDNRSAPRSRMTVSTVAMRAYDMGVAAMRLLLEELTTPEDEHLHRAAVLEPQLVARQSSARRREDRGGPARAPGRGGTPHAEPAVRFENHATPALGIGEDRPRLSWRIDAAPPAYRQAAYEVEWRTTDADGAVRDSGALVVESEDQLYVPWPGAPLPPRATATARVRVRGADADQWGPWSAPAVAERTLASGDWRARLVGPGYDEGPPDARRAPLLRHEFVVAGTNPVRRARLYVTAHGLAEVELNGTRVGADELVPGWTPYHDRLRVFTYDVTSLVRPGANALGAWLADGWFRGRYGFGGGTSALYGEHVALLAQLEVVTDAGTQVVASDPTWRSAPGPLTRASLYDGETFDARLLPAGWSSPGFDDTAWTPAVEHALDPQVLLAPDGPPVRCTDELAPVAVTRTGPGTYLLDFGQNHSGRLRLRVPTAPAGTTVRVRHAEVLQDGALYTRTLRDAAATDELVGDGRPWTWEPRFTVHGFRYAEVSGWPGEDLHPEDVRSRVLHSAMDRTGWFESSDAGLDRLHENVVWSLRSNFVDLPTDCPQRDERLGWTGDIQVFAPTAAGLYDVNGFLADWLRSVASEQERTGTVPVYVPWIPGGGWRREEDIAAWGDAAVLVPWTLFERYGDRAVLRRQYDSARAWVDRVARVAGPTRLWTAGRQLGDWLDPTAPPEDPAAAQTDPHLVATAYFAHSARTLARAAAVLGRPADAEHYGALADEVRSAYQAAYLPGAGWHDTQTAHALAIAFDLVPDAAARDRAGRRLAELVREGGNAVGTGFVGTPLIADALSSTGHTAAAYDLLLGRTGPSWLAMVDLGATTIWERWDSMRPDGTVNPGEMTSFNHYALGAVVDWVHRVVAGLAPAEPGFRKLRVAPRPGGGLTRAAARRETPYGPAAVAWHVDGDALHVEIDVPVGATADVDVLGLPRTVLGHGRHALVAPLVADPPV